MVPVPSPHPASDETGPPLRQWLDRDPVGNVFVIAHAFPPQGTAQIWIDDPAAPRAVLALEPKRGRLALTATHSGALEALLDELPPGEYPFSAVDLEFVPVLEGRGEVELHEPAWLYRMAPEDYRATNVHETAPVRPEDAARIAQRWAPDRNAVAYVRSRIETGMTAGIYEDGELVAWDMTHVETEDVVVLGFLYVARRYRGRGYAKTVTSALLERVFALGKTPAIHVTESNEIALGFSEGMGFRRVKRQAWGTVTFP